MIKVFTLCHLQTDDVYVLFFSLAISNTLAMSHSLKLIDIFTFALWNNIIFYCFYMNDVKMEKRSNIISFLCIYFHFLFHKRFMKFYSFHAISSFEVFNFIIQKKNIKFISLFSIHSRSITEFYFKFNDFIFPKCFTASETNAFIYEILLSFHLKIVIGYIGGYWGTCEWWSTLDSGI